MRKRHKTNGVVSADKPWGVSRRVLLSTHTQVEHVAIRTGGYSSVHVHRFKSNVFLVLEGSLIVAIYDWCHDVGVTANLPNKKPSSQLLLHGGDVLNVEPWIPHQFVAPEPCVAYEVYTLVERAHARIDPEDIVRFSKNGCGTVDTITPVSRHVYCCLCNRKLRMRSHDLAVVEWHHALRDMCADCVLETKAPVKAGSWCHITLRTL